MKRLRVIYLSMTFIPALSMDTKTQPLSLEEQIKKTLTKTIAAIHEKIRIKNHRKKSGQEDDFVFTYPETEFTEWECVTTDLEAL